MINRELVNVVVKSFQEGIDDYGQRRQLGKTETTIDAVVKPYKHSPTESIQFQNVEKIVLTKYSSITDADVVVVGSDEYQVQFVQEPFANYGYYQVFLKK